MPENEIMTLEEVAAYIRVSERTVYDWAQKGDIPGGKIGTAWRFKREDVLQWVDSRLNNHSNAAASGVSLSTILAPERILRLDLASKKAVFEALFTVWKDVPQIRKLPELREEMYRREELMSTGIGFGVGVPHVRLDSVRDLVVAIAVTSEPITDYESLDGKPVQIVCMIAANSSQHTMYIKALSAISKLLRSDTTREAILGATDSEAIFSIFTGGKVK